VSRISAVDGGQGLIVVRWNRHAGSPHGQTVAT
jgi:hypothetical protein